MLAALDRFTLTGDLAQANPGTCRNPLRQAETALREERQMGVTALLQNDLAGWRELVTGSSRIDLRYTSDMEGGTYYVLRVRHNSSYAITFAVTQKHLPPQARLVDSDSIDGYIYHTYHLKAL